MRDLLDTESSKNMAPNQIKACVLGEVGKTNNDTVSLRCTKGQTWIKLIVGTAFPSVLHSGVEYASSQSVILTADSLLNQNRAGTAKETAES